MATAAAAKAGTKRCPGCGETDVSRFGRQSSAKGGLRSRCKRCCTEATRAWQAKHPYPLKPRLPDVACVCSGCGKGFGLRPCRHRAALRQNPSGRMFCSVACYYDSMSGRARSKGAVGKFKRRRGWSDERWEWERRLVEIGLGMDRGISRRLQYGLEPGHGWDWSDARPTVSAGATARAWKA